MRRRQPVKMKVMTIVHGKSELKICEHIRSNLRIKHGIYSENKDKKEYSKLFPLNRGELDIEKAKLLYDKLKSCDSSNLGEYILYCIKIAEEQRIK